MTGQQPPASTDPDSKEDRQERKRRKRQLRAAGANVEVGSPRELLENAERLAGQAELDPDASAYLYRKTKCPLSSRADWEHAARIGFATDYLLSKVRGADIERVVDFVSVEHEFANVKPGTLLMSFHGGFVRTAKEVYQAYESKVGKTGHVLKRGIAEQDPSYALFAAVRALQSGQNFWVVPDGPVGNQTTVIEVLGTKSTVGDGAALMAHSVKCPTAFCWIEREGERLRLRLVQGPTAESKEPFGVYRTRFHAFYTARIEDVLTGDPRSIKLRPRWVSVFAQAEQNLRAAGPA